VISKLNIYFCDSYLAKGQVEKLEVVNKKWVRVRLFPGQAEGGVSLATYFENFSCIDFFMDFISEHVMVQHRQCRFI